MLFLPMRTVNPSITTERGEDVFKVFLTDLFLDCLRFISPARSSSSDSSSISAFSLHREKERETVS